VPDAEPLLIGVGPRAKSESVAVAAGVLETKNEVAAEFWNASEFPSAEAEVQIGSALVVPALEVVTVPVPQVTESVIVPVELPPFVTQPAPARDVTPVTAPVEPLKLVTPELVIVTEPVVFVSEMPVPAAFEVTPLFESVVPLNESPVPMVGVVSRPVLFMDKSDEVASAAKIVDELKVAVELNAVPPMKVCNAVQVTLEAAVTKPGFTKLSVTEPVAFETEMFVPAASDVTGTGFDDAAVTMPDELIVTFAQVYVPEATPEFPSTVEVI
jgi:hypothetical protein